MNAFAAALDNPTQEIARTHNGAITNSTSLDKNVDLFGIIGNRNKDFSLPFADAYAENSELALRTLLWARDIRGGAGERETVRRLLLLIERTIPHELDQLMPWLPEFGRWDDLLIFQTPRAKTMAFAVIQDALANGNGLCAKWMPRKGKTAAELRNYLGMSPKAYRKYLVGLTNVVETDMCAKRWGEINYSHVPSVASARYQKAFGRHDAIRYGQYLASVKSGQAKINAAAVYPYDVIKSVRRGVVDAAQAQWDALPDYLGDNKILPLIDVSGSMINGANPQAIDVSVSLGLYVADKQKGAFKDMIMTFSADSKLYKVKGDLEEKMNTMERSPWGMNTNIQKAFANMLMFAQTNRVPAEDMPKMILIVSDMEFDRCAQGTNYAGMKDQFENSGYYMPKLVFWNVNSRVGNMPVTIRDENTALVSGFSPNILKSILSDDLDNFSPKNVMLETLMQDRYNIW